MQYISPILFQNDEQASENLFVVQVKIEGDLGEGIGLWPSGLEAREERGAGVEVEPLDVEGVDGVA